MGDDSALVHVSLPIDSWRAHSDHWYQSDRANVSATVCVLGLRETLRNCDATDRTRESLWRRRGNSLYAVGSHIVRSCCATHSTQGRVNASHHEWSRRVRSVTTLLGPNSHMIGCRRFARTWRGSTYCCRTRSRRARTMRYTCHRGEATVRVTGRIVARSHRAVFAVVPQASV